mmetsp:Transcript_36760/g.118231  ORF Transcript_36760/g.118231 Transcript_36760/m.118231 type:complete len:224 (+) Transcript_36760:1660-2331(+)
MTTPSRMWRSRSTRSSSRRTAPLQTACRPSRRRCWPRSTWPAGQRRIAPRSWVGCSSGGAGCCPVSCSRQPTRMCYWPPSSRWPQRRMRWPSRFSTCSSPFTITTCCQRAPSCDGPKRRAARRPGRPPGPSWPRRSRSSHGYSRLQRTRTKAKTTERQRAAQPRLPAQGLGLVATPARHATAVDCLCGAARGRPSLDGAGRARGLPGHSCLLRLAGFVQVAAR